MDRTAVWAESKGLDALPPELMVHILRYVPTLSALRASCRSWFALLGDGDDSVLYYILPPCVLDMLAHAQRVARARGRPVHPLRLHVLFEVTRQVHGDARLYCIEGRIFYWGTIESGAPVGSGLLAIVDHEGRTALRSSYRVVHPPRDASACALVYGNGPRVSWGDWALGFWDAGRLVQGWVSVAEPASAGPLHCTREAVCRGIQLRMGREMHALYCDGAPRSASYMGFLFEGKCHGWDLWAVAPNAGAACAGEKVACDVRFCGYWQDGTPTHGTFMLHAGRIYTGSFRDRCFHGRGTLGCPDGTVCRGDWVEGSLNGQATLRYSLNTAASARTRSVPLALGDPPFEGEYSGACRAGKRHGSGTQTFPDGSTYDGGWYMDRYHGRGIETHADGTQYVGRWKRGQLHGIVDIYPADGKGRRHHGYWIMGKRRSYLSYRRHERTGGDHGTMVSLLALPLDAVGSVWDRISAQFTIINF